MKTGAECLPCFLKQAIRVTRLRGGDEEMQQKAVCEVAKLLPGFDLNQTPPALATKVYQTIGELLGCEDPYREVKKKENELALRTIGALREEVLQSDEPLMQAIGCAIAGNIIDYGAAGDFDFSSALARARSLLFTVDHRADFREKVDQLPAGASILYLADNCGEIIYDSLVVELLAQMGMSITVAVREGPIINDALVEDALTAGLDKFAKIITSGAVCPGTPLDACSGEFLDHFWSADMVISKGQGNFETLSEVDREIFFCLTVKCPVAGRHMADLTGVDEKLLPGNGELAVYNSGRNLRVGK